MSSGKEGKEGKEGAAAKVAGAAVAVGVAWGIFRFVKAKKEEDALIQEYYGDREDFTLPDGDRNDYDAEEVYIEEQVEFVKVDPPPPPPMVIPPHSDELKSVPEEEIKATEKVEPPPPEPEPDEKPKVEEKPWFLRLFDPPKKTDCKPKLKESESFDSRDLKPKESYEIKRGDTLWAISGKYGISLDDLKAANGLHGDNIYAGDKLVIPPK
ncbi:hypothetical protein GOP47_0009101 [Adiantum capillus-veneris]|uniref:LysM domain-containing protein n=1 Tax=Adiantum capillus-veneris TaxID=13818 RepID=A0A9D4ZKZ3_ADICA|nr:hypothetical protein GOP47_0008672 [Adiantum capillus-veneris]KAI5077036.1 hypothetical protein GOP47_0009101 [Adiantum capillus-veneris]